MHLFPTLTPADAPAYPSAAQRATFWRSMQDKGCLSQSGTGTDSGAGQIPGWTWVYPWYRWGTQVRIRAIVCQLHFIECSYVLKANSCKNSTRQARTYGFITQNFPCAMVSRRETGSMNITQALSSTQIIWQNMCCMSMIIRSEFTWKLNADVIVIFTV